MVYRQKRRYPPIGDVIVLHDLILLLNAQITLSGIYSDTSLQLGLITKWLSVVRSAENGAWKTQIRQQHYYREIRG